MGGRGESLGIGRVFWKFRIIFTQFKMNMVAVQKKAGYHYIETRGL